MRKLISFMHVSLDGFVAGPKGEMNWIKVNQDIFDYVGQRISKGDTALYGRVTYQMMENYWPTAGDQPNASKHDKEHSQWYKGIQKVVLSNSLKEEDLKKTTVVNSQSYEKIRTLKNSGNSEILIFGSPGATHALMEQNLVDGFWLFVNPVVLGKGIPLFKNIQEKIELKLLPASQEFACGVRELNYEVLR